MTFAHVFILFRISQGVVTVFFWQRLFICKKRYYLLQFGNIATSFYGKLKIFFKLTLIFDFKHSMPP